MQPVPDTRDQLKESAPPEEHHQVFRSFEGDWQGTTRTWFEPGKLADESSTRATFRIVLGGRFLQLEYAGSLTGYRMEGRALIGFNSLLKRYEMSWVDTCHNGHAMMNLFGDGLGAGFGLTGSYPDPSGGPSWGWRIELEANTDAAEVRMYNITPFGEEALGVESKYRRG